MKVLKLIKENLIVSILISSLLGLLVGRFYDVSSLKNLIIPLTIMMVYPMMIGLNFNSLRQKSNVKLIIVTQLINFLIFPLISFVIGYLFFQDNVYLRLGLLLITLLPTSGMTISWTVMSKGNVQEAIRLVVIGLLLGGLLSPFYISGLLGSSIDAPFIDILRSILIVIFIPLVLGFFTQKYLIKKYGQEVFKSKIKPNFPLISTAGIILMIFTAMSLRAKVVWSNPLLFIEILFPVILLYSLMYITALLIGKKFFNRSDAIALVNGTLVRNLSLSLAIILTVLEQAAIAALLVAISFIVQVQFAAWNTKLHEKIYGKLES